MAGEIKKFKRNVFGGFDCNEVVEYISRLSAQRNEYKATGEKLDAELEETKAELEELRLELTSAAGELEEVSRATAAELDKIRNESKALEKSRDTALKSLDEAIKERDEALKAKDEAVKEQDAVRLKAIENTQRTVQSVREEKEAEKQRYEKEIAELNKRREEELAALEKSHSDEISKLKDEYERRLRERETELDAYRQRVQAIRDTELNSASETIKELDSIYGGVRATLDETSGVLNRQLEKVRGEIAVIVSALDKTGKCITSLYDAVEKSKAEIDGERSEIESENI